jgi:hypothetical protein
MPSLVWDHQQLMLPMLRLPSRLREGYRACEEIHRLVVAGELERTKHGVDTWIRAAQTTTQQRTRRRLVQLVTDFLAGERLEDAAEVLTERYRAGLAADPAARAAQLVARVVVRKEGADWLATDEGDELVLAVLPGWVAVD